VADSRSLLVGPAGLLPAERAGRFASPTLRPDLVSELRPGKLGIRGRVAGIEGSTARRGVERDPAPAREVDLDPVVSLVVGHRPLVLAGVVAPAREAGRDARRNAEVAEHERHRAREVLAITPLRVRHELD